MWRFFGYYGGLNVVGNLHNYGQFSDDSTFQLVPAWHNKAQAMAFEDAIYTRMSHYSYELKNNKITYPDDVKLSKVSFGIGFDIHRLVKNKKLYLGGTKIPFHSGLQGHSDGDVILHAIIDAILGACLLYTSPSPRDS